MAQQPPSTSSGTGSSPDRLVVADAAGWRTWLDAHEETSDAVRLVLAK